jgi:hypothetical protein
MISSLEPNQLASRLKIDWSSFKKLILEGKIPKYPKHDPVGSWRKLGKSNLPRYLHQIEERWNSLTFWEKILVVRIMRTFKLVYIPKPTDFRTVILPINKERVKFEKKVVKELNRHWHDLGIPVLERIENKIFKGYIQPVKGPKYNLRPTLKGVGQWLVSGPFGKGIISYILDIVSILRNKEIMYLLGSISNLFSKIPFFKKAPIDKWLKPSHLRRFLKLSPEQLEYIKDFFQVKKKGGLSLGKITYFLETGGKIRYIKLGNWVVQSILKPLNSILILLLRSINQDCTYHQEKVFRWHKDIIEKGDTQFYSLDLSSKTDRLPLRIQSKVLSNLFHNYEGEKLGKLWIRLIKLFTYNLELPDKRSHKISYGKGQGIGLYTSWSSLKLTNHKLIRLGKVQCGIVNFNDYLVLGDDVVINNRDVKDRYRVLMNGLGVSIRETKSIIPSELQGLEFKSKFMNSDGNISPLPTKLLDSSLGKPKRLEFISQLVDRVLTTEGLQTTVCLETTLKKVFGNNQIRSWETISRIWIEYYLIKTFSREKKVSIQKGLLPGTLGSIDPDHSFGKILSYLEGWSLSKLDAYTSYMKNHKIQQIEKKLIEISKIDQFEFNQLKHLVDNVSREVTNNPLDITLKGDLEIILKGPLISLQNEIFESLDDDFRHSLTNSISNHERLGLLDSKLTKREYEILEISTRLGKGLRNLYNPFWKRSRVDRNSIRSSPRSLRQSIKIQLLTSFVKK